MTVDRNPDPGCFAVLPVADYEPPTGPRTVCWARTDLRTRSAAVPGENLYRTTAEPAAAEPTNCSARQAAMFADAALRRVLEVIDRRRPVAALRNLLSPNLIDPVLSLRSAALGQPAGAAMLRRTRVQTFGSQYLCPAEVSGTFSRGNRVHAIACRVEQISHSADTEPTHWQVVALHIG